MPTQVHAGVSTGRRDERIAGRRVLVLGLGRFGGGVGVAQWLAGNGAHVVVTDQARGETLVDSVAALGGLPIEFQLGGHDPGVLDRVDFVVINPAVQKERSEFFRAIVARGIPWTTEINLFCERCPATVIGVTGSYGKSTTCAMLAFILERAIETGALTWGRVHLGGNIGRSLLGELPSMRSDHVVVLELSSAQLEDSPRIGFAPTVAIITNIHAHHLDRHGTLTAYAKAKLNIVSQNQIEQPVVVGELHPEVEPLLHAALGPVGNRLHRVVRPTSPFDLLIHGEHNQANAACVLSVCQTIGLDETFVRGALANFRGLPHRLELVRDIAGVAYYNDSKSTAPSATVVAVRSIDRPIVALVGGQRKEVDLTEFAAALARVCRHVICFGESGPWFADAVRRAVPKGSALNAEVVDTVATAVVRAQAAAAGGDVVLFSPGAPSFDGYVNFEARGRDFVEHVNALR